MKVRKDLSIGGYIWWIIINTFTLGFFYFLKLAIMKAIIDSNEQ